VRKQWTALPAKGISAVYFACLGLGFMFFEITMIQRLTRFLGYPTYSLTVTLASILVFTGLGALWSGRLADRGPRVVWSLVGVLAVLTVFYQLFLDNITDGLLDQSLAVRVIVSLLVLAPLGLCLGMFMPLGLRAVSALTPLAEEYVAWAWAVNGFFSVIGSVLTTILSMTFGFRAVQLSALGLYAIAAIAFVRLSSTASATTPIDLSEDDGDSRAVLSAPRP
jgi:MFS family permease